MSYLNASIARGLARVSLEQHLTGVMANVKAGPDLTASLSNPKARARFLDRYKKSFPGLVVASGDLSKESEVKVFVISHGTMEHGEGGPHMPTIYYSLWKGHRRRLHEIKQQDWPVMTIEPHGLERAFERTGEHGPKVLRRVLESCAHLYMHGTAATQTHHETLVPASTNGKDYTLICYVRKRHGVPCVVTAVSVDRLSEAKYRLWGGWRQWLDANLPSVPTDSYADLADLIADGSKMLIDDQKWSAM